jgi:hypothetical protein
MTQDNLCGADGRRAPDPVAEARADVYGSMECHWEYAHRKDCTCNADLDDLIAAVRRAALEEAAEVVKRLASDDAAPHGDDCGCAPGGYDFECFAAAIDALRGKEGT